MAETKLVVCINERMGYAQQACGSSGSRELIDKLKKLLAESGQDIPITEQVCLGRCEEGVVMRIAPGGEFFIQVTEQDLTHIIQKLCQFKADNPV